MLSRRFIAFLPTLLPSAIAVSQAQELPFLEIYEVVNAEALHAGEFYYGTVSPEKVDNYLQNLKKAGLIKY